jgi:hypothetical protein
MMFGFIEMMDVWRWCVRVIVGFCLHMAKLAKAQHLEKRVLVGRGEVYRSMGTVISGGSCKS